MIAYNSKIYISNSHSNLIPSLLNFQFVTFAVLIAAANAGLLPAAPVVQPHALIQPAPLLAKAHVEDYDPNPQYNFNYAVHDDLTGDSKHQEETRSGDVVQGSYSLIDADGFKRTVDYTADPVNGFNAVVSREPLAHAAIPVAAAPAAPTVIAAKTVVAQPIVRSFVSQPALVAKPAAIIPQPAAIIPQPAAVVAHQPAVIAARAHPTFLAPAAPAFPQPHSIAYAHPNGIAYPQSHGIAYPQPHGIVYPQSHGIAYPQPHAFAYPQAQAFAYAH